MSELSGYRAVWLIVLFDLPVTKPDERKTAAKFRTNLLKMGFTMMQFSVYKKHFYSKEKADNLIIKLSGIVPDNGSLDIAMITDKQYENIVSFYGKRRKNLKNPEQLTLF